MIGILRGFVFLTALYSIYAGVRGNVRVYTTPGLPPAQAMMASTFGCMAVFIGVLLILCSRDLQGRGQHRAYEPYSLRASSDAEAAYLG